jgi:two-component system sensor histidine kinase/response regulator
MDQKNTILVVDDIPENVEVLLNFLDQAGFKVLISHDGEMGLETAEYALPDLILLDILMPGWDGFETCQRLKANSKTKNIPVIFMTALSDTMEKVKAFKVGAADYITKPIQYEEVLARVNAHLQLRQQQLYIQNQNQALAQRTLELQARTEELEKRNLELDAFAHTVAHDLKNPLGGVVGLTEVLLSECSSPQPRTAKVLERLGVVAQAGQQAINIIDALLLLAGVSRQKKMVMNTFNMATVINKIVNQRLNYVIKQKKAQVEQPAQWSDVYSYAPWVEEIWINYISNAIKYGGHPPHIILGETLLDNSVRFWVQDNGEGLTPEAQADLFTPFNRLHQKRVEGHGLGLSIVQQIVEKLGGEVGVDSTVGQGSTFYFTLPKKNQSTN